MAEIWKNNKYFEQTNNRNFGIFDHDFALCHFNMMAAPLWEFLNIKPLVNYSGKGEKTFRQLY